MDQVLGWTATVLFTVCYIPQIIRTLRSGTVNGLSVWMFLIMVAANIVALVYAILIDQPALIVKYTLALGFLSATLCVVLRVQLRERGWS
jgi:uncharacterized protein with PQ loop repeat